VVYFSVYSSSLFVSGYYIGVLPISADTMATVGRLFYLMGPSGSGKDTLLRAVLSHIQSDPGLQPHLPVQARRFITRAADAGGEAHQSVTKAEFEQLLQQGQFCMNWQAHGNHYAISSEVLRSLSHGRNVLVNGSRAYLSSARDVVPDLVALLVEVPEAILHKRLQARARESDSELAARMSRKIDLAADSEGVFVIDNSVELEESVQTFCDLIIRHSKI